MHRFKPRLLLLASTAIALAWAVLAPHLAEAQTPIGSAPSPATPAVGQPAALSLATVVPLLVPAAGGPSTGVQPLAQATLAAVTPFIPDVPVRPTSVGPVSQQIII